MCQVSFDAFRGDLIFRAKVSKSFNEPEFAKMTKEKRRKCTKTKEYIEVPFAIIKWEYSAAFLESKSIPFHCIREGIKN